MFLIKCANFDALKALLRETDIFEQTTRVKMYKFNTVNHDFGMLVFI